MNKGYLLNNYNNRKEKRRHQLNKRNRNSVLKRIVVSFFAIAIAISSIITVLVSAFDGSDYESAPIITFENNKYIVPSDGMNAGLYKFSVGTKKYVFTAENHIPGGTDITLITNPDGSYKVKFEQDPPADAENILTYANLKTKESGNSYSFEIKNYLTDNTGDIITGLTNDPEAENYYDSAPTRLVLQAGHTYYYRDDTSNKYYYFTPSEDFGYNYVQTRVPDVYQPENAGNLLLTLSVAEDGTGQWAGSGDYYTRKVIYERATSFDNNHVYLITAKLPNSGTTEYMIRYTDGKYWNDLYDNYTMSGGILPKCPNWHYLGQDAGDGHRGNGEWVYNYTVEPDVPNTTNSSFFVKTSNGQFNNYTARYYYDGMDGNFQENSEDTYFDSYIYSEFATYPRAIPRGLFSTLATLFTGNSGVVLMGYDGNGSADYYDKNSSGGTSKGYYTSNKALGGIYSANPSASHTLLMHKMCTEGLVAHNYGSVWTYDYSSKKMRNKNTGLYPSYLSFGKYNNLEENAYDGKEFRIAYEDWALTHPDNYIKSDIYIYEMKNVYTRSSIEKDGIIGAFDITATVNAYELDNATINLSYVGSGIQQPDKEFSVTLNLRDEHLSLVSGKWSTDELVFTDGIYQTTMHNGKTIPLTNIPKGYSINITVDLPDNELYYSTSINGISGTEQNVVIDDNKTIPIVITDTRKKAHIPLTFSGDNIANPNEQFPVALRLTNGGNPVPGAFVGTDINGNTVSYVFDDNGECSIPAMSNDQAIDIYVPDGYELTTTVTLPTNDAIYYSSTVNNVNGTAATTSLSSDKDIPIVVNYNKEIVTITNYTYDNPDQSGFSEKEKKFPLKVTLLQQDGNTTTPVSGDFMAPNGTTYSFDSNGICTNTIELADQESISLLAPKSVIVVVEDAERADGYSTTYSDPTITDSPDPLNTVVNANNTRIDVKHTRDFLPPVTGLIDSNNNYLLIVIGVVLSVCIVGGIVWIYRKKDTFTM